MFKTLKSKFSAVYIGLVTLTAIVGCFSVFSLYSLQRMVDGLMTDNYKSISAAQNMTDSIEQQDNAALDYISFDSGKSITDFNNYEDKFDALFDLAGHNITEKGEKSVIDKIGADYSRLKLAFSQMQLISDKSGKNAAENFYNTTMQPAFSDTRKDLSDLILINQEAMFKSKNKTVSNARFMVYLLMIISSAAITGGYFISRHFVNRFLYPLGRLTESLSRVKAGELGLTLEIKSNDETGRLAYEFNQMTKRLSAYEQSTVGSLTNERNKFVAIVRSISDPIVVLDGNYRIILINSASEKMFSIEEGKVSGRHFLDAIHEGALFDRITQSVEQKNEYAENVIKLDRGGKTYYFNVVVTKIKGIEEAAASYILLLRNVTELKELDLLRADLFAAVSHELKTPLTSIIMGASLLSEEGLGELNSEQKDIVRAISDDGERLSSFVSEILDITKIESEKTAYDFAPCSVVGLVENACAAFKDLSIKRGVEIINTVDAALPLVRADYKKISWVMNNLLSNALKYTHAGDSVTIGAVSDGKFVRVSVSDTGIGIPKELQSRIFDRFVHLSDSDLETRGSGIGLSVVKDVILAHGGAINVESAPDRGSTFFFTLPEINTIER